MNCAVHTSFGQTRVHSTCTPNVDTQAPWMTAGQCGWPRPTGSGKREWVGQMHPGFFLPSRTPSWWGPFLQPLWEAPDAKRSCPPRGLLHLPAACPEVGASMGTRRRALLRALPAFSSHGLDPGPPRPWATVQRECPRFSPCLKLYSLEDSCLNSILNHFFL